MTSSIDLLNKALEGQRKSDLARELGLSNSIFTMAAKRGRLSPTLAGALAGKLQENPEHWIAIAALEAEPEGPLRETLMKRISKMTSV